MATPVLSFLGAGNMGEAMLRGLAQSGHTRGDLRAYDPRSERLQELAKDVAFTPLGSLVEAVSGCDVLVLAVKPQSLDGVLAQLGPLVQSRQAVVSIAAGVRLERIQKALSPGVPVIRVMPNTPGLIGQGISAYCLGSSAGETHAALAEALLKPLGKILRTREQDMDAVTALSGSGPAYVFLFMEALLAAGADLGLGVDAAFLLAGQTLAGAAAMIQAGSKSPAELRAAVTSPGGTTAAALKVFEEGGLKDLVRKALLAARDRSAELGRLS
ncbi:MAG: pyrroline-5-carboxylate reductase [bacterium]